MKIQIYDSFRKRIHESAKEKGALLRVMFELTYRCNFKCKHCYVPESFKEKSKQELKTKEVFFIIDQLQDLGCFYLGFTGGEPFLRKDVFKVLWYAKKKGFQIIIYTNGSLIDAEVAQELKRLNPNKVDITIPAMSKAAFEQINGISGSREKVFRAIDLLYKHRVRLGFKSCVLKENEKEIKEIQDFAASLEALHRLDDRLSPRLDGDREPYRFRGRLTGGVSRRISKAGSLFKCGVGVSQAAITPFGELKMCLMIDYPKYKILNDREQRTEDRGQRKQNLKEAWLRLKKLVAAIKPDENYQCDKCNLEPFCRWCPGKSWLYNGSFTACDPINRQRAESMCRG